MKTKFAITESRTENIQHQPSLVGAGSIRFWIFCLSFAAIYFTATAESIINTVHNLSASGPGTIKAVSESDACVFCHTAHHTTGETPLWSHTMSSVSNYVVYTSARFTNLNLTVPQPNGSSRLCLSCHDGTVALGDVSSGGQIAMQGGVTTMPGGSPNNLGTDLSTSHPVSFVYDSALAAADDQIKDPATLTGKVRLDSQKRLQCTACHNPHDNQFGNFLVMDNTGSRLCLTCHQLSAWSASEHAISATTAPATMVSKVLSKSTKSAARPKSMSVSGFACQSCHANHQAGSDKHLLQSAVPEQNCLVCHSGGTARKDIAADLQKMSIHPVTVNSQSHSATEDIVNPSTRHVGCADCHNSHAAKTTPAIAPGAPGALSGMAGVTAGGGLIKPLQKEYELCFRCHGDSMARGPAFVPRQQVQSNKRLQFAPGNQSFHPVVTVGKNLSSVSSLVSPWTANSVMYCTDCHASDSSPAAGGSGAKGPHGSIYAPILERNLSVTDNQPESPAAYALCYKCHDRERVLSNVSFRYHTTHVVDDKAACTTCHDSHGVANAPHLINFNTDYVTPVAGMPVSYKSTGFGHGVCTLTCHGKEHKATAY